MKSRIFTIPQPILHIIRTVSEDRVSLHAAHASFFVITSAVPFASVLFTCLAQLMPEQPPEMLLKLAHIPVLSELFTHIKPELSSLPTLFSTFTTLWSASRGISGVRMGLETIYRCREKPGYVLHRLRSLLSTVFFILLLAATVGILLFGDLLGLPSGRVRFPIFAMILTIAFTGVYVSAARRSDTVKKDILLHLPGAVFSTLGWIGFSWGYSMYITHFSRGATVTGGLTAVCLMMLWLYFCMMILLLGAELNKLLFVRFP